MQKFNKNFIALSLLSLLLISYLVINTGIISDDFDLMHRLRGRHPKDMLTLKGITSFIELPFQYFTHYWWYYLFRIESSTVCDTAKILYMLLSFYLISRFFLIYLDRKNAFLVSFFFLFFPTHDATVYWFMVQYLTLSFAFYLYAFYLAYNNKLALGFLAAMAASFVSYGSPPIAVALFLLFALHKKIKKGLVLLVPNLLYVIYYVFVTKVSHIGVDKTAIEGNISIYLMLKQFMLQMLTFVDSTLGPSMWLKVYHALLQLSLPSLIIGIILVIIFYKKYREVGRKYNAKLVLSFAVLAILSFGMLAITGRYPQLAFNLGNRVTIFGSLLLAYLIVLMPVSHKLRTVIFALMIFTILGISDHWKNWNINQTEMIKRIKNNQDLKNYNENKILYVSGNQYSKFGPISHIEFLSEPFVSFPVFQLALENDTWAYPINKRYVFKDTYLIDTKHAWKDNVRDYINIYDSEKDVFFTLPHQKINDFIDSLPPDNRHWIQLVNIPFIKNVIVNLMPRLKYAL